MFVVGDGIPSRACIQAHAQALARYAALCQEAGVVPVVEPEVLMDGEHDLERCREVTEEVLRTVFNQLYSQRVMLESMILKPNIVLPGLSWPRQEAVDEVADATVRCFLRAVPAAVGGIALLNGLPIQRTCLRPVERYECQVQVETAMGAGVFVRPRHPAPGSGNLARRRGPRVCGAASPVSSSQMRPRCTAWRVQCRDGKGISVTNRQLATHETHGTAKTGEYQL